MKRKIFLLTVTILFISQQLPAQVYDTMVDLRDNRTYKIVKIGEQTWLAENLKFIPKGGSWCYKGDSTNCDEFGRLYRWEVAKRACPKGWHLPTDSEWFKLIQFLGGGKNAGRKMRSSEGWEKPSQEWNNSSGFSALPGGRGSFTSIGIGVYEKKGYVGYWWTATESGFDSRPPYYYLDCSDNSRIYRDNALTNQQFSVRCLKD